MEVSSEGTRAGVKLETHVRVEQTARGVWYCTGLDVYGDNSAKLQVELDGTMSLVEMILQAHNGDSEEEKQHTDLSTSWSSPKEPRRARP